MYLVYITPSSIDNKRKKEKPSSSTIIIQDKVYSLLVKVLHDTKKVAIRKLVLKAKNDIITRSILATHQASRRTDNEFEDEYSKGHKSKNVYSVIHNLPFFFSTRWPSAPSKLVISNTKSEIVIRTGDEDNNIHSDAVIARVSIEIKKTRILNLLF